MRTSTTVPRAFGFEANSHGDADQVNLQQASGTKGEIIKTATVPTGTTGTTHT